jgi:heptosyltransferase II
VRPQSVETSGSRKENDSVALDSNAAASGALVKITPLKRRIIRALELVLLPLVRAIDWLGGARHSPQQGPVQKILIVEYWQMGDAILLLAFLKNLRRCYPQAHIAWMVSPRVAPLLADQNLVDELIPVRVPWAQHHSRWRKYNPISLLWLELARRVLFLRRKRYDMAMTGRMDIRDNLLMWLINARQRIGYSVGGGQFLLTDVVTPDLRRTHRSHCWLRLLEFLGKPVLETQPRLKLSQRQQDFAGDFLTNSQIQQGDIVVGIHPGARIPLRQWGQENFFTVAKRLAVENPVKILWFEEPNESPKDHFPEGFVHVSVSLENFLSILARCDLLICNDSGPMHMAGALGVPVVAVFGPQQPLWFGPTTEKSVAVYRPEFWCRPCFDYCIFDQPYCLRTVSIDQVFDAASRVTKQLRRGTHGCEVDSSGIAAHTQTIQISAIS